MPRRVHSPLSDRRVRRAAMAFREVRVFEVREVLRLWLRGEGFRSAERLVGVDRKTVRRYVTAAVELGLVRDGGGPRDSEQRAPTAAPAPATGASPCDRSAPYGETALVRAGPRRARRGPSAGATRPDAHPTQAARRSVRSIRATRASTARPSGASRRATGRAARRTSAARNTWRPSSTSTTTRAS